MAQIVNGYAHRVLSTRLSDEYQEGPEEESWHGEYNLPFKPPKRSASHSYDSQDYPVKRPRNNLEASHPYNRQEEIRAGMNGNINGHPSLHLPAPANLPMHERSQYGPAAPRPNMVQSTPYHQIGTQSNSIGQHPRLPSQPHFASPTQGNYASSRQSTPQRNHMSPLRAFPHTESNLRQPEDRKSLAKPFRPGQNTSRQLLQPQNPQGSRASSVAPSQGHTGNHIEFTSHRYQSVPPLPAAHERSVQYAVSGAGASGHSSQPSTQKFQPSPQGFRQAPQRFQHSSQGLRHSPQRLQPSPMQARPNTILQTEVQPGGKYSFANEAHIQKRPVMKQSGPFIIDDDEEEIGYSEALKPINTEARINTATVSQKSVPTIDFSQGRRGGRSLTHGLDDPKDRKNDAISSMQKKKSGVKKSKKADNSALQKLQQQAEAYAKIKEKEDMAAKANDTSALFEEPINEAAQARIKASMQKEEMRKLEIEAKRKHNKALAEDLERIKKEADEREKAHKEAERAEKASRKSKTREERETIQKMREAEEQKRLEEQRRKAEELLLRRRQEQSEREALAREKEAAAESKRQQDAENLKKTLEASRLAATSLKPIKKGQGGREENGERATMAAIETAELPVDDDGGLFVPDQIGVEPSDETIPKDRGVAVRPGGDIQHPPLTPTSPPRSDSIPNIKTVTPNTEQKISNIAATIKEIPGSEALSLRALAGWRGARKANTETKVASIVIEHHKEKLSADQKMHDEALAQERARERVELKEDFAAFFDNLASTLTGQVKGELKVAVDKVLNVRPPTVPMNARSGLNPARGIIVSPKKYASETQCFLRPKATKLAPLGEKTPSNNETRRREKDELRLAEKAKKRFEVKLHRDNAEQSRSMTEYEFRSHIERQKEYREKREKKFEKEKRMMPHGGGSSQGQVRFGYEDIDFNEVNSSRPNKSNSQSDKGRCGGVMARLRESNGSLGYFQEAAAAKIVDDRINHLGDDTDSESDVSEEDPDDDEADTTPIYQSKSAAPSDRRDRRTSSITATEADSTAANGGSFGSDSKATQLIKPRHLQDKKMVYIYSVQRSEIRDHEKSLPITIKQFFDRDDANEFAEEELRRTRWGPSVSRPQITQSYSKETGLFNGSAAIDSEENMIECVDVVAQAQYIGDLDDFEHEKVKVIFKPKVYFVFKSITKKVQTPMDSYDDEASENEEAEQNMEIDQSEEAEQPMEKDQNEETQQNKDMDQNDNENSDDRKSESSKESDADAIDALFEEEAELSDNSGHNTVSNIHQLSLDSTAPPESKPEMTLTQTSKPLEVYTDRELANKRASEIFLAEIRPVGGDISQLIAFQNDAVKPIRENLESHNKSGELFSASNDYASSGEEVRVWVEDFEVKGPLN